MDVCWRILTSGAAVRVRHTGGSLERAWLYMARGQLGEVRAEHADVYVFPCKLCPIKALNLRAKERREAGQSWL